MFLFSFVCSFVLRHSVNILEKIEINLVLGSQKFQRGSMRRGLLTRHRDLFKYKVPVSRSGFLAPAFSIPSNDLFCNTKLSRVFLHIIHFHPNPCNDERKISVKALKWNVIEFLYECQMWLAWSDHVEVSHSDTLPKLNIMGWSGFRNKQVSLIQEKTFNHIFFKL